MRFRSFHSVGKTDRLACSEGQDLESLILTPQGNRIDTTAAKHVINMCANNYLGLADNPEIIAAAKESYDLMRAPAASASCRQRSRSSMLLFL